MQDCSSRHWNDPRNLSKNCCNSEISLYLSILRLLKKLTMHLKKKISNKSVNKWRKLFGHMKIWRIERIYLPNNNVSKFFYSMTVPFVNSNHIAKHFEPNPLYRSLIEYSSKEFNKTKKLVSWSTIIVQILIKYLELLTEVLLAATRATSSKN